MGNEEGEVELICPQCRGTLVRVPSQTGHIAHCAWRGASFIISTGDKRIKGRVWGTPAGVSKVVREMLKEAKRAGINISRSTIGILNTGDIEEVQSISVNVSTLVESGHSEIAKALKNLTEAVAAEQKISSEERAELLDQLEELSRQATLKPEERAKTGVIKAILTSLATGLSAASGLAELWSTWGPAIRRFFGL